MRKNNGPATLSPEWPRWHDVSALAAVPKIVKLETTEQERKDLARRFMVREIEDLSAELTLERVNGGNVVRVKGVFKALIHQECGKTQAILPTVVTEPVEGWFADQEAAISLAKARRNRLGRYVDAELPMLEEAEDPEPLDNGGIDLGELVAQHVSLAIDPYLRLDDESEIPEPTENDGKNQGSDHPGDAGLRRNPFAALKDWRAGRSDSDE